MDDMEKIMDMVNEREGEREISDACARVIASLYHDGGMSESYAFMSTGVIKDATSLWREMFPDYSELTTEEKRVSGMLGTYLIKATDGSGTRPAVEGWSDLWL